MVEGTGLENAGAREVLHIPRKAEGKHLLCKPAIHHKQLTSTLDTSCDTKW